MSWQIEVKNPREVLGAILSNVPDLKLRPAPALQDLYIRTTSALIKLVEKSIKELKEVMKRLKKQDVERHIIHENIVERGKLTRFVRGLRKQTFYLPSDRDKLLVKIYDTILESENMGLLRGFGMANQFGDPIKGNPERQSVKPIIIEKEKYVMKTKDLQKAAKELNNLMGLDPEIDVDVDEPTLKTNILEAAEQLTEDDEVTSATQDVIDILKAEVEDAEPEEKPTPKGKAKPGLKANDKAPAKTTAKAPAKAPAKAGNGKGKTLFGKKVEGPTQTSIIQDAVKAKKSRASIVTALAKFAGKDEKWANGRLRVFEKSYGEVKGGK